MKRAAFVAAAVAFAAVLYLFDPAETPFYPPCRIRLWTGWSCPGCGATRALHALLHGRVAAAWALNPLWTLAAPGLCLWLAWRGLRPLRGRRAA
ncbi:MAG: DUF2752 domain-containing protein [Bryobacteraceae bacterium]|nr:DUF2752 domain-containing protein [Bryobacteraceae bacterium]MCX7604709.1 DUF2752 domain-containing protein [Bryobacteraceae bacterium]